MDDLESRQPARDAVPLAEATRGPVVETTHLGHLVALDAEGAVTHHWGDPDVVILPRSAVKPFQAVAALRNGLDLPPRLLALAAASHGGETFHQEAVREILATAGLDETALRNPAELPLHPPTALALQIAGGGPSRLAQCCSGKHAAMLVTSASNGWDLEDYLNPRHPIQLAGRRTFTELTGTDLPILTTDGCGAPAYAITLTGLARGYQQFAPSPEPHKDTNAHQVGRSMREFPNMVAGPGRPVTDLMNAVPHLLFKDGADGTIVGVLTDGRAFAAKVLDGSGRPFLPVAIRMLGLLGALDAPNVDREAVDRLRTTPITGGTAPVGSVHAAF